MDRRYYFPCRKWLRLAEGLHHKIPVVQHDPNEDLSSYTITVTASPELVAGQSCPSQQKAHRMQTRIAEARGHKML